MKTKYKFSAATLLGSLLVLNACGEPETADIKGVADEPTGFAVVSSDYTVTSISLLKPNGELLAKDFINSGSASTGLVTALSGDVVLPSRGGEAGVLTIIDRFRTDVVTRVEVSSGEVLGQVKTHAGDAKSYSSNPQDYHYVSSREAWVTRSEPNLGAGPSGADGGIDLLKLDPAGSSRLERISFWGLNGMAERTNPDTMAKEMVTVYARPMSMVWLGDRPVVGIANTSLTFDAMGKGKVAWVDIETKSVSALELPGLQNCGDVAAIPGDNSRAMVSCKGFYLGTPRDTAGLVLLHRQGESIEIERVWRGAEHPSDALAISNIIPLGGTELVAVEAGKAATKDADGNVTDPGYGDRLYLVDVARGSQQLLLTSAGQYTLGSGSYQPSGKLLLIPDASVDEKGKPNAGVRTYRRGDDNALTAGAVLSTHNLLPPRMVRPL